MNSREWKNTAADRIRSASYDLKKLALISTGVTVLFSLVSTLLSWALGQGSAAAGGIGGMGLRAALGSVQVLLSLAGAVFLPFWQAGFVVAALGCGAKKEIGPRTLLSGFSMVGPILRLSLLFIGAAMGVVMVSSYIATFIFMLTPLSDGLAEAMYTLEASGVTVITEAEMMTLLPHTLWLFVLTFAVLLFIGLPLYYRFRFSEFVLLEGERRAMAAMAKSSQITRFRRLALLKLDLSYWWYYLLQALASALMFIDTPLKWLNITGGWTVWAGVLLSSVATLLLAWCCNAGYMTTWAVCYQQLRGPAPEDEDIIPL